MDFNFLDKLLKYFSEKDGFRTFTTMLTYMLKESNTFGNVDLDKLKISTLLLLDLGLIQIENQKTTLDNQKFLITFKGYKCVYQNISVEEIYTDKINKEKLEKKNTEWYSRSFQIELVSIFHSYIGLIKYSLFYILSM